MSNVVSMIKTTNIYLTDLSESLCKDAEEEFKAIEPQHTPQELNDFIAAYTASCLNMKLEENLSLAIESIVDTEKWTYEDNEEDIKEFSEAYFEDMVNGVIAIHFDNAEYAKCLSVFLRDISINITTSDNGLKVYIHDIPNYIAICMLLHIPLSSVDYDE